MTKIYYKLIEIWTRIDKSSMKCYNIFQRLSDEQYAVQSGDTYNINSLKENINYLSQLRHELFIEIDIEERGVFCNSIEEAINKFEEYFSSP